MLKRRAILRAVAAGLAAHGAAPPHRFGMADVFLEEFLRLFNHVKARNRLNAQTPEERAAGRHLCETDAWTKPWFTKNAPENAERLLYA